MSSSVALQQDFKYTAPPSISIVEQIPSIPEYEEWLKIAQRKKTQVYTVNDAWYFSSVVKVNTQSPGTDYGSLESHISDYLDKAYFVDGSIAQLISDNIDDLF